ncbi:hypothetical protein AB1Y20_012064 [Prymnesium parvum]|uniref:Arp2/3 complex 41 kDa subunit n=1 Tax=Prymnesium parvum TaxID=97485 RepID=A0AB34IME9_PRYPA
MFPPSVCPHHPCCERDDIPASAMCLPDDRAHWLSCTLETRVEDKVTCHAWNADRSLLAVCPNNNEVHIFRKPPQPEEQWTRVYTLKEHDALVTEIAWAPKTNRILTTAQDRNAYVWTLEPSTDTWKPMLVILRISSAATSVKWCTDEQKFAVGSGAKTLAVCNHDEANNFWVSKQMKNHTSTVVAVAWDPSSSVIIATASTDYKCRVFSAYLKAVDGKEVDTRWGKNPKFGTLFFEISSLGWVRDVCFDAMGSTLAFCSHNSTVSFVDVAAAEPTTQVVRLSELPLTNILFLPDGNLVGVGHCYDPILFGKTSAGWAQLGQLSAIKGGDKRVSSVAANRQMFQAQASTGQNQQVAKLDSVHQNKVCGLQYFNSSYGATKAEFTTSALDGKIAFWTRDQLSKAMKALEIS